MDTWSPLLFIIIMYFRSRSVILPSRAASGGPREGCAQEALLPRGMASGGGGISFDEARVLVIRWNFAGVDSLTRKWKACQLKLAAGAGDRREPPASLPLPRRPDSEGERKARLAV